MRFLHHLVHTLLTPLLTIVLQNKALRCAVNKDRRFSTKQVHIEAKLVKLKKGGNCTPYNIHTKCPNLNTLRGGRQRVLA